MKKGTQPWKYIFSKIKGKIFVMWKCQRRNLVLVICMLTYALNGN